MEFTIFFWAALLLMIGAVAASFTPMIPAGVLSIGGILVYWWSTGYASPGSVFLAGFVLVGVLVVVADWAAGVVAARAGGASTRSSLVGGVVGFVGFFVLGPLGIILGLVGTVFLLELYDGRERGASARAAGFALLGALGSGVVQFVLTLSLLLAFVLAVVV